MANLLQTICLLNNLNCVLCTAVGQGDSGGPFICPDSQGRPVLCGIASFKICDKLKMCNRASYFLKVTKYLDWIANKTNNARQDEEYLVTEPMLPKTLQEVEVPGYLVRINGPKKSCTGTLYAPNKVLTSGNCIEANKVNGNPDIHVYHFKSDRGYDVGAQAPFYGSPADLDISPNITKFLHRPLGKQDAFMLILRENVDKYEPLKIPPANYKIKGVVAEYEYNDKASAIQQRNYKQMDQDVCLEKLHKIDQNLELHESHTCVQRVYSAEADKDCSRDLGGPLVCEDKYFCGFLAFQACGPLLSSLPQIAHNNMYPLANASLQ